MKMAYFTMNTPYLEFFSTALAVSGKAFEGFEFT